jgi:hypothetical protein
MPKKNRPTEMTPDVLVEGIEIVQISSGQRAEVLGVAREQRVIRVRLVDESATEIEVGFDELAGWAWSETPPR